jgi:hypothetical protein
MVPIVISSGADAQGFGAALGHFHSQPLPFKHNTVCRIDRIDHRSENALDGIVWKSGLSTGSDLCHELRLQRLHTARKKQTQMLVDELGFSGWGHGFFRISKRDPPNRALVCLTANCRHKFEPLWKILAFRPVEKILNIRWCVKAGPPLNQHPDSDNAAEKPQDIQVQSTFDSLKLWTT